MCVRTDEILLSIQWSGLPERELPQCRRRRRLLGPTEGAPPLFRTAHQLHSAAASAIPATVLGPIPAVLGRVGRVLGPGLSRGPWGASGERQDDEERGEPFPSMHRFLY
jgi:hypothetical protein